MSLSDEQMQELGDLWLGKIAITEIGKLRERVAELMLAIAQDGKSMEYAKFAAGKNAVEIRELRRQKKQWQEDSDSWKLHSVKQMQEIADLALAKEQLESDNARLREYVITLEDGVTRINNCGVDLRSSNARLKVVVDGLEYDKTQLRYFVEHKKDCPATANGVCDCGLGDMLVVLDALKEPNNQ